MLCEARFSGTCAKTKSRTKNLRAPFRQARRARSFEYPKGGVGGKGRPLYYTFRRSVSKNGWSRVARKTSGRLENPTGQNFLVHLYWGAWVGGGRCKNWSPGWFLELVGAISDNFVCRNGQNSLIWERFLDPCAVTKSRTKNLKVPFRPAWKAGSFEYPKGGIGGKGRP